MSETTFLDTRGRPAPEPEGGAICGMLVSVGGQPVLCGKPEGHRSPHGYAHLPGAPRGSRVPGRKGHERAAAARAASGGPQGRHVSVVDYCAEPSGDGALACGYAPGHRGKHAFDKLKVG